MIPKNPNNTFTINNGVTSEPRKPTEQMIKDGKNSKEVQRIADDKRDAGYLLDVWDEE